MWENGERGYSVSGHLCAHERIHNSSIPRRNSTSQKQQWILSERTADINSKKSHPDDKHANIVIIRDNVILCDFKKIQRIEILKIQNTISANTINQTKIHFDLILTDI
jgi:hypothetical protein